MPAKKRITKDMILQTAMKILKKDGMDAVNIKNLTKELHCSTQPVYLSFNGMDELRGELTIQAVHEFEDIMRAESEEDEVCLYGMEYIYFAKKQPQLFCFLFMRSNAYNEMKQMLSPIIEHSIDKLMKEYKIHHEEADQLHDHLWMHTHGIAAMIATSFCDWNLEKVQLMLVQSKEAFTKKYEV